MSFHHPACPVICVHWSRPCECSAMAGAKPDPSTVREDDEEDFSRRMRMGTARIVAGIKLEDAVRAYRRLIFPDRSYIRTSHLMGVNGPTHFNAWKASWAKEARRLHNEDQRHRPDGVVIVDQLPGH